MTRGDIFMVNFGIPFGSEVGYKRPVIIIQSDKENLIKLNTTLVIPLTSNTVYADYKGNVYIKKSESGLSKDSVALVHQLIVVDKFRLDEKIASLNKAILRKLETAIDYVLKD